MAPTDSSLASADHLHALAMYLGRRGLLDDLEIGVADAREPHVPLLVCTASQIAREWPRRTKGRGCLNMRRRRTKCQLQVLGLQRVALAMLDQLAGKCRHVLHKVLGDVLQHLLRLLLELQGRVDRLCERLPAGWQCRL